MKKSFLRITLKSLRIRINPASFALHFFFSTEQFCLITLFHLLSLSTREPLSKYQLVGPRLKSTPYAIGKQWVLKMWEGLFLYCLKALFGFVTRIY